MSETYTSVQAILAEKVKGLKWESRCLGFDKHHLFVCHGEPRLEHGYLVLCDGPSHWE